MDPNQPVLTDEEKAAKAAAKEARRKAYEANPNKKFKKVRKPPPVPTPEQRAASLQAKHDREYARAVRNAVETLLTTADQCKLTPAEFRTLAECYLRQIKTKIESKDFGREFLSRVVPLALAEASQIHIGASNEGSNSSDQRPPVKSQGEPGEAHQGISGSV